MAEQTKKQLIGKLTFLEKFCQQKISIKTRSTVLNSSQ